ncbi:hypothetical protein GCM10028791_37600 [Echinicola sediminis]
MVVSYSEGQLTGLLSMVLDTPLKPVPNRELKGKIVGAGQYESEYQSWLASTENTDEFIQESLLLLKKEFPQCDIYFRFLTPKVPKDWLYANKDWKNKFVIQAYKRPLVRMNDPEIDKLFRKKEFKNKYNRLKRQGELVFEQIKNPQQFEQVLPILIEQFEFRQRAMFNKSQFSDNPIKEKFIHALFEQGLLHATVLKVNDHIVASILGLTKNNRYHLGAINTHSPVYGNHSPGFVHFILLCELLSQNKEMVFDLTPGGDPYKERMANDHDYVEELYFPHSPLYQKRQELKYKFHDYLMKFNIRPMTIQLSYKKEKYRINHWINRVKSKGLKKSISDWKSQNKEIEEQLFLLEDVKNRTSKEIHMDSLNDLLHYEENQLGTSSWDFLKDAMLKFANEFHALTCTKNGKLICLAWLVEPDRWEKVFNKKLPNDQKYPVLLGLEYHPKASKKLNKFVDSMVSFIKNRHSCPKVFVSLSPNNQFLKQLLAEKAVNE